MFEQSPKIMLDANYLSPRVAFDQFGANTPPSYTDFVLYEFCEGNFRFLKIILSSL